MDVPGLVTLTQVTGGVRFVVESNVKFPYQSTVPLVPNNWITGGHASMVKLIGVRLELTNPLAKSLVWTENE